MSQEGNGLSPALNIQTQGFFSMYYYFGLFLALIFSYSITEIDFE